MLPAVSRPVFQPGGNLTVSLQLFASLAVSSISALSFDKDLQLDLGLTRANFQVVSSRRHGLLGGSGSGGFPDKIGAAGVPLRLAGLGSLGMREMLMPVRAQS